MFAYCNNNPANLLDPTGTVSWAIFGDNHIFNPNMLADFGSGGSSCSNGGVSTRGSYISTKDYLDANNPEIALENLKKYNIAYYNGVFVIKTPFDASFSLGFIGLSIRQLDEGTLRHEYGHTRQLDKMGLIVYITDVAAPSAVLNILDRQGKLEFDYYSYPFEAEANALGGSSISQSNKPKLPEGGYASIWDLVGIFFG